MLPRNTSKQRVAIIQTREMTREETRIFVAPVVRCFPIDIILLISRYIDTQI